MLKLQMLFCNIKRTFDKYDITRNCCMWITETQFWNQNMHTSVCSTVNTPCPCVGMRMSCHVTGAVWPDVPPSPSPNPGGRPTEDGGGWHPCPTSPTHGQEHHAKVREFTAGHTLLNIWCKSHICTTVSTLNKKKVTLIFILLTNFSILDHH